MAKIAPISGFPEWLPEQRMIEQHLLDHIRARFELFGFAPIETRAVEPTSVLLEKGETDKEIYTLHRIHEGEESTKARLGLHFDLTVPFARYVAENQAALTFPIKRYQMQKVWRGERPQEGRYREFLQADIDVVAMNELPLHYDAEMPLVLHRVLSGLPIPPITIAINNRKVLEGFYRAHGIENVQEVLRIVDKIDKIGEDAVRNLLVEKAGVEATAADACVRLGRVRGTDASVVKEVRALGAKHALLDEGLDELGFVMGFLGSLPEGAVVADLHIARGLDYYTGTVYEGTMRGHEVLGSVCSGGRYDDLVGGKGRKMPGVGVSIGVTRILGRLFGQNLLRASRNTPSCVLVTLASEESRLDAFEVASALRDRGIATEVFHAPVKFGKQIQYAQNRGIPFVWFPPSPDAPEHAVRDIRTGAQAPTDPTTWRPPEADLNVRIELVNPTS